MLKWCLPFVLFLALVSACSPASAPTPTPTKAAPVPAVTATKPAAEATKPAPVSTPIAKPAAKPLEPPVSVKVGGAGSLTEAFLYIADAKGYFVEEGLKVEFIRFRSASEMVAPMGTGELDAGGGSPSPALFNAILRGIPVKIVADRTTALPGRANMAIMLRKDLVDSGKVRDFSDFRGKTIAINGTGTSTEIFLEKALEKGGLKMTDVNVVTMGFPDTASAFAGKAIDVAVATDPSNARSAEQGLAVRWKGEDEVTPNHEPSVLLYGPNFYQTKPEAAKRLMVAYVRGIRDYLDAFTKNKDKEQMISILMNTTEAKERSLYDRMTVLGVNPDGYADPKSIAPDRDWYFSKGLMQQKVDLSKVIDNQYVEYALERLGKYQP